MNLKSLYKNFITNIYQKSELNRLMDEMSGLVQDMGEDIDEKLYDYVNNRKWGNMCLFPLIHTICNKDEGLIYTKLNAEDYELPFPIFNIEKIHKLIWKLKMSHVELHFIKNKKINSNLSDIVITKDYRVSKTGNYNTSITVFNKDLENKSREELNTIVIKEMTTQLALLRETQLFYQGLVCIDDNVQDNESINKFLDLLKNKKDLLKVIALFPTIELQKLFLAELASSNTKMNDDEPVSLLLAIGAQLHERDDYLQYGTTATEFLKVDLLSLMSKFEKEKDNSDFYKLLLAFKLNKGLRDGEVQKRPKI